MGLLRLTRIYPSNVAAEGSTMPRWWSHEAYEDAIAAIPDLRGWWDAMLPEHRIDVDGKCSQLTDRSGGGRHLVMATDANRPTIAENHFGSLGGMERDALAFSGAADLYLETAANFYDGASHSWTYAALVVSQGTGTQAILSNAGGNEQLLQQTDTQWRLFSPVQSLNVPDNSGIVSRVIASRDQTVTNTAQYLQANGLSVGPSNMTLTTIAAGKLRMGMAGAGAKRWNGQIAMLLAFKRVLTAGERTLIDDYFKFRTRPAPAP